MDVKILRGMNIIQVYRWMPGVQKSPELKLVNLVNRREWNLFADHRNSAERVDGLLGL
jgi:hypothetical protein